MKCERLMVELGANKMHEMHKIAAFKVERICLIDEILEQSGRKQTSYLKEAGNLA